ncbi:spaetzle-processing enzyme-like [Scaptodrosophila lebanonensis]|uniref:CLIP domain-containing serine protease n=1 Tax=Drosophila lebanonensis TaxID=7225 RepID=A0A6J2T1N9_DROLE|nr:spaetzle-processing enzyme-like [Scaptodrosophila lebanonensis]
MTFFLFLLLISAIASLARADTAAAALSDFGACTAPSKEPGLCIHIQDCLYLYEILNKTETTDSERKLLMESQCGLDNTRVGGVVERILVCCPNSRSKKTPSFDSRNGEELGDVLPQMGTCGTFFSNYIIGGTRTKLDEFPWMVLIRYKKPSNQFSFGCGGALINTRYVLTAGHCLSSLKLPDTWLLHSVRLGEWDTSTAPDCVDELNGKRTCAPLHIDVEVERRILHEMYDKASIHQLHDIALLRLKESVAYTEYVKPICLPISSEVRANSFVGYGMDVAGWGSTQNATSSEVKLKLTVDVWNITRCQDKYDIYRVRLSEEMQMCAGGKENEDTCGGDSGGPLMLSNLVNKQVIYFAAGITSYGPIPCGLKGWPGVYTRVGAYIDWIREKLQP